MDTTEQAVNGLNPWVDNLLANDLDPTGITDAFWIWYIPEIMLKALDTNVEAIFISENSWDGVESQYQLLPWKTLSIDYNRYVHTMNEFFVTGASWDILTVICR